MGRYLLLAMLAAVVLSGCGPETPVPYVTGPAIGTSAPATAPATPESAALSPLPEPTVGVSPTIAPILPTPTNVLVHPTPTFLPTPDINASTVPELDGIVLANPRPLLLPQGIEHYAFGVISWSPDGSRFLGNVVADEVMAIGDVGYPVMDMYLGDGATGEVSFLQHNAGWPAWSRDGKSLYYLSGRVDDQQVFYDLYRQNSVTGKSELLLENVGETGAEVSVAEMADGRLLLLNHDHQVGLFDKGTLAPLGTLVGKESSLDEPEFFSLSPDGLKAVIGSARDPFYIVDLAGPRVIAELGTIVSSSDNIGWSADSDQLAFATNEGVHVYNLASESVTEVITPQDLGLSGRDPDGLFSSLFLPIWSVEEDTLLVVYGTPDWAYDNTGHRYWYLFAVTIGGSQFRALARSIPDAVAPGGTQAIVTDWSSDTLAETKYIVNIEWGTM